MNAFLHFSYSCCSYLQDKNTSFLRFRSNPPYRTLLNPSLFSRCFWYDSEVYKSTLSIPANRKTLTCSATNIIGVIFHNLTENSCPIRNSIKKLLGMVIQLEITVKSHFWAKCSSKIISIFLSARRHGLFLQVLSHVQSSSTAK